MLSLYDLTSTIKEFLQSAAEAPVPQTENPISQVGMSTDPSEAQSSVNENG